MWCHTADCHITKPNLSLILTPSTFLLCCQLHKSTWLGLHINRYMVQDLQYIVSMLLYTKQFAMLMLQFRNCCAFIVTLRVRVLYTGHGKMYTFNCESGKAQIKPLLLLENCALSSKHTIKRIIFPHMHKPKVWFFAFSVFLVFISFELLSYLLQSTSGAKTRPF